MVQTTFLAFPLVLLAGADLALSFHQPFPAPKRSAARMLSPSLTNLYHPPACPRDVSTTKLGLFLPASVSEEEKVFYGLVTVAGALLPYYLTTFVPNDLTFQNKTLVENPLLNLFRQVYADDATGRTAEVQWKTMYATLGLGLTGIVALSVWLYPDRSSLEVLKDCLASWAAFYCYATTKIQNELGDCCTVQDVTPSGFSVPHWLPKQTPLYVIQAIHGLVVIILLETINRWDKWIELTNFVLGTSYDWNEIVNGLNAVLGTNWTP